MNVHIIHFTCMFVMVSLLSGGVLYAQQSYLWTGSVSSNWTDGDNWTTVGGDDDTYPGGRFDSATITNQGTPPVYNTNGITVGKLIIESGTLKITQTGAGGNAMLTVEARDGIVVASGAKIEITKRGILQVIGRGYLSLAGSIEFTNGGIEADVPGELRLSVTTIGPNPPVELLETYLIIPSGSGTIVGTQHGRITVTSAESLLILDAGNTIEGHVTIESGLVNNGLVHANVASTAGPGITLTCHPKAGGGTWKVSGTGKLTVEVPVVGSVCSRLEVISGQVLINADWVSCGTLDQNGGIISVSPTALFESGRCSEHPSNQSACGP